MGREVLPLPLHEGPGSYKLARSPVCNLHCTSTAAAAMRATSHSTYGETLVVGPRLRFMQQERRTPSYRVFGSGTDPVVVVPGGPLLDGTYLGDLGGLSARRALAVPELPRVRVSQVAGLIEAVRKDIDLETVDVVAHSAGAPAALFYSLGTHSGFVASFWSPRLSAPSGSSPILKASRPSCTAAKTNPASRLLSPRATLTQARSRLNGCPSVHGVTSKSNWHETRWSTGPHVSAPTMRSRAPTLPRSRQRRNPSIVR